MDTQPLMPGSSGPFSTLPSSKGNPLLIILLVILGLGTVIFGALTVTFSSKAASVQKSVDTQKNAASAKARDEQKQLDNDTFTKINESPFRAYTAPEKFGSFIISFPKNWSSYVDHESQGTQVQLVLNPDFVRKTDGQDEAMAVRVILLQRPQEQYMAQYQGPIKSGIIKKTPTTVSHQPAYDLTGKFNGRKTLHEVVVPIRDKVLIFSNESQQFAPEFNTILGQAKINP